MQVWVQTRGRSWDYRFLGSPEPTAWWTPYLQLSSTDQRTLVVETGPTWRAYVTGLQTTRLDGASPPRQIRNSLLIEGAPAESARLSSVVEGWLRQDLDRAVDGVLEAEAIEAWRDGTPSAELLSGLESAIGQSHPPSASGDPLTRGIWHGRLASTEHRAILAREVGRAAGQGTSGVFAILNLQDQPADFAALRTVRAASIAMTLLDDPAAPASVTRYEVPREVDPTPANPTGAGCGRPRAGSGDGPEGTLWVVVITALVLTMILAAVCTTKKEPIDPPAEATPSRR